MANQMAGRPGNAAGRRRGPRPPGLSAAGFGLLEVLVATTLMGLVLVAVLQVLTASLSAQEASLKNSQAVLVADKVLQEYGGDSDLPGGEYQGREGPFAYRVRRSPLYDFASPEAAGKVVCTLIQVTVSWEERGRAKSLGLETIRSVSVP